MDPSQPRPNAHEQPVPEGSHEPAALDRLLNDGLTSFQAGQYDLAVAQWEELLQHDPKNYRIMVYLSLAYNRMEAPELARGVLMRAVKIEPRYPKAWNNLGNSFRETGELYRAVDAYEKAVNLSPRSSDYRYNLAITYLDTLQYDLAIEQFRQYRAVEPNDDTILSQLCTAYYQSGQPGKALSCVMKYLQRHPETSQMARMRAQVKFLRGLVDALKLGRVRPSSGPRPGSGEPPEDGGPGESGPSAAVASSAAAASPDGPPPNDRMDAIEAESAVAREVEVGEDAASAEASRGPRLPEAPTNAVAAAAAPGEPSGAPDAPGEGETGAALATEALSIDEWVPPGSEPESDEWVTVSDPGSDEWVTPAAALPGEAEPGATPPRAASPPTRVDESDDWAPVVLIDEDVPPPARRLPAPPPASAPARAPSESLRRADPPAAGAPKKDPPSDDEWVASPVGNLTDDD